VVLITGASSGLGMATAELLARSGCRVYGANRTNGENSNGVIRLPLDLADEDSVRGVVEQVIQAEGGLDVLVNNAGMGLAGAIENFTSEEMRRQFEVVFFGLDSLCRAALPHLRQSSAGKIVNISSIGGLIGLPFQGAYSAAKFAVEGYSEALRLELKPFGIHVSIINPGDFHTGFTSSRIIVRRENEDSPYRERFLKALSVIEADERGGCNPILVARTVRRIIFSRRPAFRYLAGRFDQRLMARIKPILPHAVVDWLMLNHYRAG
jgi:NAD(P)-dependent dehydrogenase (short-subunit alcohol dehydrogenase family)